jgi:DNA-binding MarR family transcriptional regulator
MIVSGANQFAWKVEDGMIITRLPSHGTLLEMARRYPDMDTQVCEAYLRVLRTGMVLHHCLERSLARLGLSYGRFMLLCLLKQGQEPVPVCKLAGMAGVTTPTVSAVLAGMARDGLVERLEDASDKRVVRIGLLPAGQSVLDDVLPGHFVQQTEVMRGLEPDELNQLVTLLAKVRLDAGYCSKEFTR